MHVELSALESNNNSVLTSLPSNKKPIGCKWVYKIKYNSYGLIERHKARLVTKRYNQKEGLDFFLSFSPAAKIVTMRIVLSLAVIHNWSLFHLDVNNAFLYGDLDEQFFMKAPPSYLNKRDTRVCKLQ